MLHTCIYIVFLIVFCSVFQESTAASYIDESILTLAPSKLSIVRRAFGICSVADSVAQHSLPSRRTAVQAEMLQVLLLICHL
jgi:hypothetical protein